MRPKYHQSEIKMFLMCGLSWQYRYVDKIRMPGSAAAMIGSVVDTGVSANLAQKVSSGIDLPVEQVLDVCATDFEKRAQETVWDEDDQPGPSKDAALSVLKFHHLHVAPLIQPVTVQEQFVIETDAGYDLGGAIDYTDKAGFIGDTKTASRQKASSYSVNGAFQPALYSYAYNAIRGEPAKGFRFDIITRPTVKLGPEYKPISGQVTEADHAWLFNGITAVHKAIQAGVALPISEGHWKCSAKYCEYFSICKGRK